MYTILCFYSQWDKTSNRIQELVKSVNIPDVIMMPIDIEEAIDMIDNYRIATVPTFIVKAPTGAVLGTQKGFSTLEELETFIKRSIDGK